MSIGLVTRFKNERHIMYEWINHHLSEGIDKIYLINHKSNDNFLEFNNWLIPLIKNKKIILLQSKNDNQKIDYNNFIELFKENRWIIQLDIDEFLFSPNKGRNIKDVLNNELFSYDCIEIKWKLFSHRCLHQPKSVINDNIYTHIEKNDPTSGCGIKCIGKTNNLKSINIHFMEFDCNVKKKRIFNSHNNILQINHYRTQSDEYLFGVKEQRGGGVKKNKYKKVDNRHLLFKKKCLILKEKRKDLINNCNERKQIKPQIYKNSSWYKKNIKNINNNNENNNINTL